jgi:hypothetical protein
MSRPSLPITLLVLALVACSESTGGSDSQLDDPRGAGALAFRHSPLDPVDVSVAGARLSVRFRVAEERV